MRNQSNTNKNSPKPKKRNGRFASPEEAAKQKNAQLVEHIKKTGLKIFSTNSPSS